MKPKKHKKTAHKKVIHHAKKVASHIKNAGAHAKRHSYNIVVLGLSFSIFIAGFVFIWIATLKTPDFSAFNDRIVASSTKIFDRTGEILLYDIHEDVKRNVVPFEDVALYAKNATVAIEDSEFYNHKGVRPKALLRAIFANLRSGEFSQGGSTLTQQIVKNTLLTQDKRVSRKIKEWILAVKVEREFSKEQILEIYLNEAPYGGSVYGIQEASMSFFGVDALDLDLAQSAYLAAIPNAPTYFSPYGNNKDKLDNRKNLVITKMSELGFISEEEALDSKNQIVEFLPRAEVGIRAPHFVFWVREYLEDQYGEGAVLRGGLIVRTTLDYDLQEKAEEIVARHAELNNELYGASNAALVSIDPNTGQVLSMVGSKDYFSEEIDGNFNIATAYRQPGSSFKPFVYATAMKEGYEPDSVLFDTLTEFNPKCLPDGSEEEVGESKCYNPRNFDDRFKGPMKLRDALAQSRNIPAVKLLYLVGIQDTIKTALSMGITSLTDPLRYGLTLVLGGGEVQLLEMVSSYGVFATEGVKHKTTGILEITRQDGSVLETYRKSGSQVLEKDVAIKINSILSDNEARTPLWGSRSFMYFPNYPDVAGKTGTTDNKVDAWMMGYSPDIVTGVWSGNNDNTPMSRGSGISGGLWGEYMNYALTKTDGNSFTPLINDLPKEVKPVIRGQWEGGNSVLIDNISGGLATEFTPKETLGEIIVTEIHSILHWVDKKEPLAPSPEYPRRDDQYDNWEFSVLEWWENHKNEYPVYEEDDIPTKIDDIHTEKSKPEISFRNPEDEELLYYNQNILLRTNYESSINADLLKVDYFIDNIYLGTTRPGSDRLVISLDENVVMEGEHQLKSVVVDEFYNKSETSIKVNVLKQPLN
ncbi:MAG: membrane peptidoglycan carboxypeptidase [Candidatus Paceibacteria bacterium]|jgi:membrane peptidoglycan carboxypeptidase